MNLTFFLLRWWMVLCRASSWSQRRPRWGWQSLHLSMPAPRGGRPSPQYTSPTSWGDRTASSSTAVLRWQNDTPMCSTVTSTLTQLAFTWVLLMSIYDMNLYSTCNSVQSWCRFHLRMRMILMHKQDTVYTIYNEKYFSERQYIVRVLTWRAQKMRSPTKKNICIIMAGYNEELIGEMEKKL